MSAFSASEAKAREPANPALPRVGSVNGATIRMRP
ncbi:Uncharacterised protein [Mycobacteroides abscessus subsp. abscessus]|nr:Uncharacterised protein [Mycobacteroides abscessus subsp. abscessus]